MLISLAVHFFLLGLNVNFELRIILDSCVCWTAHRAQAMSLQSCGKIEHTFLKPQLGLLLQNQDSKTRLHIWF